jgi:hypothetical protein
VEPSAAKLDRAGSAEWPYALREFITATGTKTPAAAAQTVANSLLARYFTKYADRTDVVSVTKLCALLGIEIVGRLPRISSKSPSYNQLFEHGAHLAKLNFLSGRPVIEVMGSRAPIAGISAAHELGHYLIHLRDGQLNDQTLRSGSTPEEEALSEYIGRMLLMPKPQFDPYLKPPPNYAVECLSVASRAHVIMHAAAARMMDPDHPIRALRGIIFWKLHPQEPESLSVAKRLTPTWHHCDEAFIPIRKCHARRGSLVANLAESNEDCQGASEEDVRVGSFSGRFRVDAYAWGSLNNGTRCVLSAFVELQGTSDASRDRAKIPDQV